MPFCTISSVASSTQLLTTSAWNPAWIFAIASSFEPNDEVSSVMFGYCLLEAGEVVGVEAVGVGEERIVPVIEAGSTEAPGEPRRAGRWHRAAAAGGRDQREDDQRPIRRANRP